MTTSIADHGRDPASASEPTEHKAPGAEDAADMAYTGDFAAFAHMSKEDIAEYISDHVIFLHDLAQRAGLNDVGSVLKTASLMARISAAKL